MHDREAGPAAAREAAAAVGGGRLDVVATPIGNLADLSPRARAALAAADLIAAEDTRRTGQLLRTLGLSARLLSLHDYNETQRVQQLIDELRAGKVVALVSDAGTPLLSDPGFGLVRAAAAAGIAVRTLPGPSALTAALSIAGLPTDRFVFEGFLPARAAARRAALAQLVGEPRTLVFFEAPHRIGATLEDMVRLFGEQRSAVLARELTKLHETVYRGTLGELAAAARGDARVSRGEITLLVEGRGSGSAAARLDAGAARTAGAADEAGVGDDAGAADDAGAVSAAGTATLLTRALALLLPELPPARAAAIAAQLAGVPRSVAYDLARRLRHGD
ncbi:MAG TPA: 16S rRNA (cytidine(1402)-2'-O)-methyltransferase [Steroidobacteraceae bacterium]|nr:16S rRNA (cytidine(1402)-2'-O)-methyltransferase [Steroidobacteraceae bacterium]